MAWNGSDKEKVEKRGGGGERNKFHSSTSTPNFNYKALCAGLIIVALGSAALWWFARGTKHEAQGTNDTKHDSLIAETKPSIATNKVVEVTAPTNRNVRMERGVEVVSCVARTNKSGVVIEKLKLADGRLIEKSVLPKPIFRNVSDQMIAMAISTKPGQAMAPMPSLGNIDEEFAKSLLDPIRIEEGDSEKVKEIKTAVKEARAYIAAEVKNGRTVAECLAAHCAEMERFADSHTMAAQQMQKMKKEGATAEEIGEFRTRINEVFREKGIPELPTGKRTRKEEENKE